MTPSPTSNPDMDKNIVRAPSLTGLAGSQMDLLAEPTVPVISLHQPYAELAFLGIKKHETRSRPLPVKYVAGLVAIHATATFPPLSRISEELHELCLDVFGCAYNHSLTQGGIIGLVQFSGALSTNTTVPADDEDRICGDWRPNRWAWPIYERWRLLRPVPAKGSQGWWRFPFAKLGEFA